MSDKPHPGAPLPPEVADALEPDDGPQVRAIGALAELTDHDAARIPVVDEFLRVRKPQGLKWDRVVLAAYWRLQDNPQENAAEAAGIGKRSLQRYEAEPWWREALAEARVRWANALVGASRRTLLSQIRAGDADLALKVLERLEPLLAPPQRGASMAVSTSATTADGVVTEAKVVLFLPDNGRGDARHD